MAIKFSTPWISAIASALFICITPVLQAKAMGDGVICYLRCIAGLGEQAASQHQQKGSAENYAYISLTLKNGAVDQPAAFVRDEAKKVLATALSQR
jgi:hypothetical protein